MDTLQIIILAAAMHSSTFDKPTERITSIRQAPTPAIVQPAPIPQHIHRADWLEMQGR